MSYLQRLLDASLSISPADAGPSPIVAQDQRLAQFPDLVDPFCGQGVDITGQPMDVPDAALPAARHGDRPRPSTPMEDHEPALPMVDTDDDAMPVSPWQRIVEEAPLTPLRAVEPKPASGFSEEMDRTPPPLNADALQTPIEKPVVEGDEKAANESPSREAALPSLHDDVSLVETPSARPAWPIPASDFRPLDAPEPTVAPPPVRPRPPLSPVTGEGEEEVAPKMPEPPEPPSDRSPSPLAMVPETATPARLSEPEAGAPPAAKAPEVRVIERLREAAPKPDPVPMTAAEASVIGPLSVGGMGPREFSSRARG